jgi:hypothetical protein
VIWQWAIDTATGVGTSARLIPPVCTIAGQALEIDVDGNPTDDLIVYSLQGYSTP